MKFDSLREKIRGGKVDALSKMGRSKLTGPEVAKYYKDNPKARMAAKDKTVKKAIELALDLGGSYTQATKEIEKIKKGLSKMPVVQQALKSANESVELGESAGAEKCIRMTLKKEGGAAGLGALEKALKAKGYDEDAKSVIAKMKDVSQHSKGDYILDEDMTGVSSVAMPDGIPLGKVKKRKDLEEATLVYKVKGMQKPEMDRFKQSAPLMKLKVAFKKKGNDTLVTMSGNKKQLSDFDAVARGKSSFGDPSTVTEDADLLEKQFALKPGQDGLERKIRTKFKKSRASGPAMEHDDVMDLLQKKKDGKHKIKDPNTSLIVRSLARIMNQDRRGAAKKGAAFGKGEPRDEMDAPKIKKIIDVISKGMTITKKGKKIMRDPKELNLFADLDTAIRDDVYEVILQASNGLIFSLIYEGYKSGTELNEESATMKKVRQVVKKKSMMKIDGMQLDLTTASMISQVYDKVNPQNKKRMDTLKLPGLVNLTMKVAGKTRKESTDLQEVTRQEVDAMKKLSKDMQKVLQTYQKITTIGDKELKDARHNKDYKKVLDARDSILKMIGTLNTKMLMQKEAVSPKQQAILKRVEKRFPKLSKAEQEKIAMIVKPKTQIDTKLFGDLGTAYDTRNLKALKTLITNYSKKYGIEEDAVDRAKEMADLKAKHKREAEQEKDEIASTRQTEQVNEVSRAERDAMRDMGKRKDRDDDGYGVASADDRKAADKNVVMQIRKVTDLQKPAQIELRNGKKVMLKPADAKMMMKKFDSIRKPQDRLKIQTAMNDKKMSVAGLKKLLGR